MASAAPATLTGPLCEEVWGGFDAVVSASDESLLRLRTLSRILSNLVQATEEYGTQLTKLSAKKTSTFSTRLRAAAGGTTAVNSMSMPTATASSGGATWTTASGSFAPTAASMAAAECDLLEDTLQYHMSVLGEMHKGFAGKLSREVNQLEQRIRALQSKQESIVKKGKEDFKTYDEETNKLNKARNAYYRGCKQVEESEKSKEKQKQGNARSNIMQKLQDKVRGDVDFHVQERDRLKQEYSDSVKRANAALKQWFAHDLRACVDQLEGLDRERVACIKQTIDILASLFRELPTHLGSFATQLGEQCLAQVAQNTLSQALSDQRTREDGPPLFAFVEPSESAPPRSVLHVRGVKRGSIVTEGAGVEDIYMEVTSTVEVTGKASDGRKAKLTLKEGQRVKLLRPKRLSTALKILDENTAKRTAYFAGICCEVPSDCLKEISLADKQVYQYPLDSIVARDQQRLNKASDDVLSNIPVIVRILASAMFAAGATQTEGIFRVPGNSKSVDRNKEYINLGADEVLGEDAHVTASLFKLFLRELPDPVIPNDLYDECVAATTAQENLQAQAALDIVEKLPPLHKTLCLYVIAVLQTFATNAETVGATRMDASNLAMVFSACLFRSNQDGDPMAAIANAAREKAFVKLLIDNLPAQPTSDYFDNPFAVTIEYSDPDPEPEDPLEDPAFVAPKMRAIPPLPAQPPPSSPAVQNNAPLSSHRNVHADALLGFLPTNSAATQSTNLFGEDVDVNAYISAKKGANTDADNLFAD